MNNDTELIRAAIHNRFSRVAVPACPQRAWEAKEIPAVVSVGARGRSWRFSYAAAVLVLVVIAGLGAQASPIIRLTYANLLGAFVSSKPLTPLIHRADRLSIAEAQRRMPFTIVLPEGLPANTQFLYAHVIIKQSIPSVVLNYQAHINRLYYRISITEALVAASPPRAHFELRNGKGEIKAGALPMRRWKHGAVVMDLLSPQLPTAMSERIVRANTI